MQFKQFVNNIAINLKFSRIFVSMKNIRRKCNPIVNLSKFTSNKKILNTGVD